MGLLGLYKNPSGLKLIISFLLYNHYNMYHFNFSGICCPHRGAVFSYTWRFRNFPFQSDDRVACNVFFVWELLRPLLKGIPLYVIPDTVIYDPSLLLKFLKKHGITRVLFTPSLLGK